jgi:GNAT superfamily N-acetyltransferase
MEFRLRSLAFPLPHDEVWMTADGAAAAAWLPPPGRWQRSRPQRLRLLPSLVRFLGLRTASILGGLERMEARHPHDPSHWYLFILGTEPVAQGQGLGSALLSHMLARVDAGGIPAYLESSSERNLALYGRHGFEVTSEVAIPGGPRIWPMGASPTLEQVVTECPSSSRRAVVQHGVVDLSGSTDTRPRHDHCAGTSRGGQGHTPSPASQDRWVDDAS